MVGLQPYFVENKNIAFGYKWLIMNIISQQKNANETTMR